MDTAVCDITTDLDSNQKSIANRIKTILKQFKLKASFGLGQNPKHTQLYNKHLIGIFIDDELTLFEGKIFIIFFIRSYFILVSIIFLNIVIYIYQRFCLLVNVCSIF